MKRRSPLRLLKESALIRSLVGLFVTMCIACLATYVIIFFSMHGRVYQLSSEFIEQRADYLLDIYSHTDLTLNEFVEKYRTGVGPLEIYNSFEEVPPLQGVIVASDMIDGKIYLSAQRDILFGVVRVEKQYLQIAPFIYSWETSAVKGLVIHTLLLCALIASVCTVIAVYRSFRPLRKLDNAIGRVAVGDFSARVDVDSSDEIGKIARNFNWMIGELGRIEYLRRDFVSSVSHEFKTPLSAVQGSARMLAALPWEKLTAEKLKKYTGMILTETTRMSNLSSNLLRLTRLEYQTIAENIARFSLSEQLRQAILSLEGQWSAKNLDMDIQLEESDCLGDVELLFQVWTNLLTNAIKFSNDGGLLAIHMNVQDNVAIVTIKDSGRGMDEETLSRLFEKFYQGDASHKTEGSGLGLSIVKRIIDLHRGEITYNSIIKKGTLCTVRLPIQ